MKNFLGVHLDDNLESIVIFNMFAKRSSSLWLFSQIRSYLSQQHKVLYYHAYIKPHFEYCCTIWIGGWSGGAKVSCILRHRGVRLILAYSWARPAIFVAGKGRGGMFLFLLFLHFHSCSSLFPVPLFHLFFCLLYLSSHFL